MNTEIYSAFLRIHFECGKMRTKGNSKVDTSHKLKTSVLQNVHQYATKLMTPPFVIIWQGTRFGVNQGHATRRVNQVIH